MEEITINNEEWRTIPGFPGYKISKDGTIMSFMRPNPKVIKTFVTGSNNSESVCLVEKKGEKGQAKHICRLVWDAWGTGWPAEPRRCFVDHIDGNIHNNHIDNLTVVLAEVTEDYDPESRRRKGVRKTESIKKKMREHRINYVMSDEEKIARGKKRSETCRMRNEKYKKDMRRLAELEEYVSSIKDIVNGRG